MMVFKRKQIVVLSLVLMIIVAGYLQYSYKKSSVSTAGNTDGKLGEAVYVDNKDVAGADSKDATADKEKKTDTTKKSTPASKQADEFFAQAKMEKESNLSKDQETLKQITKDENASNDIKAKAYDQMMALVKNSQSESNIETLIKKIGFSDALVLFGEDGSMDIVVKTPSLSAAQVAQISDAASRQAKIAIEKIHIKPMY